MGVPKFYNLFVKPVFANTISYKLPNNISSLFLDGNAFVHAAAQECYGYGEYDNPTRREYILHRNPIEIENELFAILANNLKKIFNIVQPSKYFAIMMDGVVPVAKMSQSRGRRFITAKNKTESNEKVPIIFDSNVITPGTDFMIRLDKFLLGWLINESPLLSDNILYSSHLEPGEGEQKILKYFRNGTLSQEDTHVIYGLDADLIMLSLTLPISNIYLWRQSTTMDDVLSIDMLKYEIMNKYSISKNIQQIEHSTIQDFILIISLLGNDFVPHHPSLGDYGFSINNLFKIYKLLKLNLTKNEGGNNIIIWENFIRFINTLAKNEEFLLKHEYTRTFEKRDSFNYSVETSRVIGINGSAVETIDFNFTKFRDYWYNNIFRPKGNPQQIENFVNNIGINPFTITQNKLYDLCESYITAISWCHNYYINSENVINNRWCYKYTQAPLFTDFIIYLIDHQNNIPTIWMRDPSKKPMHVIHQMLMILPKSSINELPNEVKHLMEPNSLLSDLYPINFVIDYELKLKYAGIPILPPLDPERVIRIVNKTTQFHPNRLKIYAATSTKIIQRDQSLSNTVCERNITFNELNRGRDRGRGRGGGRDRKHFRSSEKNIDINTPSNNLGVNYRGRGRTRVIYKPGDYIGGAREFSY